jgi:tetratricopeptide (TPR) repeat protein
MAGDFPGASTSFQEVIRLDSLGLRLPDARCMACDGYQRLVQADIGQDSMRRALSDAAAWLRAQPQAPRAWELWADALERNGRLDEALAARDTSNRLRNGGTASIVDRAYFRVRAGDVGGADSLLETAERSGPRELRFDAAWWRVVALRYAGRPHAATLVAPRSVPPNGREGRAPAFSGIALGQSLFEAGDLGAAGRVFDSAGMHSPEFQHTKPGLAARHRAWGLTQRATVAAAQGDLPLLRQLEESVTVHARASGFGRDHSLPTYVRGLILEREGRLAEAADTLRAAVFSRTDGYTRTNYELARTLLALGRPREAIPWLQSALRGGMEASNYYLTRTEIHELLAQCFAAAGQPDSAFAQATMVLRAWNNAEPEFSARREAMARLAAR